MTNGPTIDSIRTTPRARSAIALVIAGALIVIGHALSIDMSDSSQRFVASLARDRPLHVAGGLITATAALLLTVGLPAVPSVLRRRRGKRMARVAAIAASAGAAGIAVGLAMVAMVMGTLVGKDTHLAVRVYDILNHATLASLPFLVAYLFTVGVLALSMSLIVLGSWQQRDLGVLLLIGTMVDFFSPSGGITTAALHIPQGLAFVLLGVSLLRASNRPPRPAERTVRPRRRTAVKAMIGAASALAIMVSAPTALASSIVYLKGGNVWLASGDGSRQYQVTFGGGYDQPSMADDGTIVAVRAGQFVRLDRSGRSLGPPVDWFGNEAPPPGSNADQFFGPYHARVSPDGRRIAYAFKQREYDCDPITNQCTYQIVEYTTTSAADHYTGATPANSVSRDGDPAWIDNNRLVVSDPFDPQQINTWVAGRGDDGEQWWFGGYVDPGGFGDLEREAALSPDGSKLVDVAAVGGQFSPYDHLYFYTTNGPAWVGDPPYDNNAANQVKPNAPSLSCIAPVGPIDDPVWSPDGTQVAFQQRDGIHIGNVPADISQPSECSQIGDWLVIPGGTEPFWGAAEFTPTDAPSPPAGGTGASGPHASHPQLHCVTPRLQHMTVSQARATLQRAHCRLGRVRRLRHVGRHHTLRVIRQSARERSTHPAGYEVAITVV